MKHLVLLLLSTLSLSCIAQSHIELDIKTGNDDLAHRDFQKGLEVRVKLQGKPDVVLENVNQSRNWANNSTHKVIVPLDAATNISDIKEIVLSRNISGHSFNNFEGSVADNWNLQQLIAKAKLDIGSNTLIYELVNEKGTQGKALFRFIYEYGLRQDNDGQEKGYSKSFIINNPKLISGSISKPTIILKAIFKTGGDDLRGGGDNVDMLIKFKNNTTNTFLPNLNNKRKWGNFQKTQIVRELPPSFDITDIQSIELRHTGGDGFAADNWYLDELKVTISVNKEDFTILNLTGTPIHYFTGESRKKVFTELTLPEVKK